MISIDALVAIGDATAGGRRVASRSNDQQWQSESCSMRLCHSVMIAIVLDLAAVSTNKPVECRATFWSVIREKVK